MKTLALTEMIQIILSTHIYPKKDLDQAVKDIVQAVKDRDTRILEDFVELCIDRKEVKKKMEMTL